MDKKQSYDAPVTEMTEVRFEKDFLDGSVGTVRGGNVSGWDSSEEDW